MMVYGKNCSRVTTDRNCNIIISDESLEDNYVQVFILKYIDSSETQLITKTKKDLEIKFKSKGDGYYTICKLTIPTDVSKPYYYKDGKYYHNFKETLLEELINLNPEVSGVEVEYIYYFSTCWLRKCFINICLEIFNSVTSVCNSKYKTDGQLTYKRDLIWSALNVIEYLVDMCQIEEAQRLLKEITECNGLCPQPDISTNKSGCGCRS